MTVSCVWLVEHTLCLDQEYGWLFQPLYTCTRTNSRVNYSGQTCGWSESTLILTNESPSRITRLNRVDQSQGSKSAWRERERERERDKEKWHHESPLLRRAALKNIRDSKSVTRYLPQITLHSLWKMGFDTNTNCQSQARLKPRRCLDGFIFTLEKGKKTRFCPLWIL